MTRLEPSYSEKTIQDLTLNFTHGSINLDPGFQRRSVWTISDRRRFVESILTGFPVPSIFLYRRNDKGRTIYDVIDGKQRLETIFMFARLGTFRRDGFSVKLDLGDGLQSYDWPGILRKQPDLRHAFESYKLQTVELTGELSQIVDVFVRINSTGKRLTSGEKRHAKYYTSPFLREADRLVTKFRTFIESQRILSHGQIERMKGTELVAELLMSMHAGGPINKKTSLDRAIGNDSINAHTLAKLTREFKATMGLVRRMFPELRQTRLRNSAEFYSLFLLVWEMSRERFVLADTRRNKAAYELLCNLSTGVDTLRDQLRRVQAPKPHQRIYADYLLTVQADTDSAASRARRREILKGLLWTIYDRKDANRIFSPEQRRIIWHSDENKLCARCRRPLLWSDFTVDHIKAWTRGGRTSRANAAPMHRACNSSKGARAA